MILNYFYKDAINWCFTLNNQWFCSISEYCHIIGINYPIAIICCMWHKVLHYFILMHASLLKIRIWYPLKWVFISTYVDKETAKVPISTKIRVRFEGSTSKICNLTGMELVDTSFDGLNNFILRFPQGTLSWFIGKSDPPTIWLLKRSVGSESDLILFRSFSKTLFVDCFVDLLRGL